jgi:hypothetical protein
VHGATDEFGFKAVDKPVHVHDLHATILQLLGFDHTKLTFRHAGRDFRLTDVHGHVVQGVDRVKNGTGVFGLATALFAATTGAISAAPAAEQIEFFETKIRPLFADHCYSCHSAKEKIKGGLRLDAPVAMLKGGDYRTSNCPWRS